MEIRSKFFNYFLISINGFRISIMPNQDIENLRNLLEAQKQEFLSVMSHELRTPMTGVKGYLSMILEGDAGTISDDVKEFVAQAYVANDRLIRLVEHMMKVARIQEGKISLKIGQVNISREAKMIVSDFQLPAKEKQLTLEYEPADQDLFVRADPDRTREVLMNLVSNAVKFTDEGGQIKVSHRLDNNWVITDVTDSGIGIKREDQDRLFEIFSKGNLSLASQEKGTGLGLYLAKRLAEAQGGKLWLEHSEPGKGSTFSLALQKY